jgi:hypothetical protein
MQTKMTYAARAKLAKAIRQRYQAAAARKGPAANQGLYELIPGTKAGGSSIVTSDT